MAGNYEILVREGYEAMNRGEYDTALEMFAPDIEWIDPPEFPDRRTAKGRAEVKSIWLDMIGQFENVGFEIAEIREAGNRTFVEVRLSGFGRESGVPVEMIWFQVGFADSEDRTVRLVNHLDRDNALALFNEG